MAYIFLRSAIAKFPTMGSCPSLKSNLVLHIENLQICGLEIDTGTVCL